MAEKKGGPKDKDKASGNNQFGNNQPEDTEVDTQLLRNWVFTPMDIPTLIKVGGAAVKGGEKVYEWLNKEGPLSIQILDSYKNPMEAMYVVEMRATNVTVHSIYLDSFDLVIPTPQTNLPISSSNPRIKFGKSVSSSVAPEQNKPKLIRPRESLTFFIGFTPPNAKQLEIGFLNQRRNLGSGNIGYWVLNEESVRTKAVEFSIRLTD